MDFLGAISKIVEITQKEGEYSNELKMISTTFLSLKISVEALKEQELPEHLHESIYKHLTETEELIKNATSKKNWWTNIRLVLPGGDLEKIKEKNSQLTQVIELINLHINSTKSTILSKLRTKSRSYSSDDDEDMPQSNRKLKRDRTQLSINRMIENPAIEDIGMMSTIQDTQLDGEDSNEEAKELAFQLVFIYDKQTYESCSSQLNKLLIMNSCWENDKAEFMIERQSMGFLAKDILARLSREHAEIKGYRFKYNSPGDASARIIDELALKATLQDNESEENSRVDQNEKPSFQIIDYSSLNGTYILRGHSYGRIVGPIAEISDDFRKINPGNRSSLKHLDIVGLVMRKSQNREMLFGFQFLCEELTQIRKG